MTRALFILLFLAGCGKSTREVRILDRHGHASALVSLRDGVKDGPVILYWPNGTVRVEGQYIDDHRSGWWRSYHPGGSSRSLTHYVHGSKDGPRIYWDSLGRPMRAEVFASGVPNGPFYRFFPNGRLAQHSNYVDGVLDGPHDQWYGDQGGTHVNGYYVHGSETGLWTEYDATGHMIWQAYLKDGDVTRAFHGERRRH
jgi:antitoxin component YwqK of YwqJK toxin-antitoxin module